MWYAILLLCGLWGNCGAMHNITTLYRDKPDQNENRGAAWAAAIIYHKKSKETENEKQKKFHTQCFEYLKRYKHNNILLARDRSSIVYGPKESLIEDSVVKDSLIWTCDRNEQRISYILKRMIPPSSQSEALTVDETPGHFVYCSVQEAETAARVFAVDDKNILHSWSLLPQVEDLLWYERYVDPIPGMVTAIRQTPGNLQAVFFSDEAERNRVGLAVLRFREHALIPVDDVNVTHIEANFGEWYYKLCKSDGSFAIYCTEPVVLNAEGLPKDEGPASKEQLLKRLEGTEVLRAASKFEIRD